MQAWWKLWEQQAFPLLLPYSKFEDTKRHKNLQVGDVCLIKYETKVAATYCLCRVVRVVPSDGGIVRTVEVQLGNSKTTKKAQPGKRLATAVQRLVLLVPVEEGLQEDQEQQRDAEVNAVVRIKGRPLQVGPANGHYDREEQKEESYPQVISHSCLPQPPTVNYLPLKSSFPMCGESLSAGRMMKLNPWAPEYWPRNSGAGCWVPAEQLTPQLPAVWASSTWLGGDNFLGIGPWPMSGPGPMTPAFGPALGGSANPLWLPGH